MYLIFIIFHRPKEILYCFLLLIVWFYWSLSLLDEKFSGETFLLERSFVGWRGGGFVGCLRVVWAPE